MQKRVMVDGVSFLLFKRNYASVIQRVTNGKKGWEVRFVADGRRVERAEQFKRRLDLEGLAYDAAGSRLFRDRADKKAEFGGRSVWGSLLTYVRGQATVSDAVEDVFESVADMQIAARAEELMERQEGMSAAEAWGQAVREMAAKVKPVIEGMALLSDSPQLEAMARDGNWTEERLYMSTLESMSHIAKSGFLGKRDSLPASWRGGLDAAYDALDYTQEMKQFADAYKAVKASGTVDVAPLEDVLAAQGVVVSDVFRDARVDAQVVESWRKAKGVVAARAAVEGSGAVGVQEALEAAELSEREIAEAEAARAAVPPMDEAEQREAAQQVNEELAFTPPPPQAFAAAPEEMRGVFRDDSCTYYAGGFYSGWVAVDKLRDSVEIQQVKVGDKGRHGVTNPLVGEFRLSAPPIFVWRRKNGDLEVISGRHRYALAEACGVEYMRADVYNEDAVHDAKWARLLDFENNMCDDQADEKTAFIYVRETGYDDETLYNKGLLRDKTRSKRGAMIARHAREELATRFMNDVVSPKDAETICTMTKDIADKGRIEEIQRRCCMLLDERKSWEYIGAMVQLMASKESVFLKQGLLDLGADFEADLARAAKYIEICTRQLNEAITVMKSGRKMSGKQAELARRLGQLTTSAEDSQQRLDALTTMKAMFDNIGMYPDLVAGAQMWDGKTEVDAVGMALERGMREAQENEEEEAMGVEERLAKAEAEAARKAAEEATGSLFGGSFSISTKQLDKEYMDAVKRGDMETARRMVNEYAASRGYTADDSWKMAHSAPRKAGGTPQQRQGEGIVSLMDMAAGFGIIPDEMILDDGRLNELGWDFMRRSALYAVRRKIEVARGYKKKGKSLEQVGITMYRAVPANVKEEVFRNGDWVTPSKEYAQEHGKTNVDGKFRIISRNVSIRDVYWNGDDICEWGYDDGNDYAYRNTANNRKLLDAVTYDYVGREDGTTEKVVVPLSKRFNYRNWDVSFSVAEVSEGERTELREHFFDDPYGESPKGWWVHGRSLRQDLDTGYAIQMTKSNDVSLQYSDGGSVWYLRPKKDAFVLDATTEEGLGKIEDALRKGYDEDTLPSSMCRALEENGDTIEALAGLFNPPDIVDSAGAYDNAEWVGWLYDALGVDMVITEDGAVALNTEAMEGAKVYDDTDQQDFDLVHSVSWSVMTERGSQKAEGQENLDDYFLLLQEGEADVPIDKLYTLKKEPRKSVDNARRFMRMAARGKKAKRGAVAVALAGDGSYTVVDGNATCLALAGLGAKTVRVKVVGKDTGSRLNNSAYLVKNEIPGADADGELRTHGLDGLAGDAAVQRAFGQAEENLPTLEKLVAAAAAKVGGQKMMRPANSENGLATKKPSTAIDKAKRDYKGDISCVVDLIGGTVVMPSDGDFGDAIKAIKKALPEGASIARVKKLGFQDTAPRYKDVKVSVRFANGGIGEIIMVEGRINEAKFNRGGHNIYEVTRELEPYTDSMPEVKEAVKKLNKLSSLVYAEGVDAAALERAKSLASKALEALQPLSKKLSNSSSVKGILKSPESLSNFIKPDSVLSTAIPRVSLIQNITKHNIPNSGVDVNGFSASVMTESQRREAVKNELARVAAMDKQVAGLAEDWERVLGDLGRVSRGGEEVKLGDGARLYAEMLSLISATRAVLPPHLAKMGHLNNLMHWAAAYAEMVQHGELPLRGGVIKGAIAEKFLQAMQKRRDALLLQGLGEQEAKEAMAQIGTEKLNMSLKKVAVACRDQLNRYVKERAWERIQVLAERAMPKSEPGHRSHKGKMDAEHYKELGAVLHALNLTEEGLEKEQSELKGRINALTGTEEGYEEKYQELQDALNRLNLYGCWHSMSASHALKAAEAFAAFVQEGRQLWKETLDVQRRRKLWLMGRMAEGMKKSPTANAVTNEQNPDAVGVLRAPARGVKDFVYGLMNMSHLVQAKKRELGDTMVVHLQNLLLNAQEGKHREKSRRDVYMSERLRIFYNCKNEADVTRTLNELQRRRDDHNIRTWKLEKHTYTLDRAEAEAWAAMTPEARGKVRESERAEAEKKKLAPPKRVAEADIERLKEVLTEMNTRTRTLNDGTVKETPSEAKEVRLTVQRWDKKPAETLKVSRLNVANALLVLEQPGYEHLVEDWGLVRYDTDGRELHPDSKEFETGYDLDATLKPLYDFVGDTCMDLCYGMRHYIDAYVRPLTEEAYNRRMGVPLRTVPLYWPGTFNISTMSAKDVLTENGGSALGQSASFTINRVVKHHAAADWNKDALEVFYRATDEQLNYVYAGELTNELRDIFMDDTFVKKLEVNCGAQWVRAVKDRILILDNSVALDAVNMQSMGKVLSRFFGQLAKDALSFNPNSYIKQASGILNGLTAGMVPRRVIARAGGTKELAYSKVGILEWSAALGRVSKGKGRVSIDALRKREFWLQRYNDPRIQERLRKASAMGSARQSVHAGVVADTGMRAMGAIDRACNAPGVLALADVFYRRLEELNAGHGLGLTADEMEEQALDAVGRALDVGAQPLTAEQKAGLLATGSGMSRFVLNTATMFKSEIFKDLAQLSSQCMGGQWGDVVLNGRYRIPNAMSTLFCRKKLKIRHM